MESFNGPPVRPPKPGDSKKTEGSFARRNNWVIIVIIAVILICVGGWFLVSRVGKLKTRLNMTTVHLDTSIDDDDDSLKVDTNKIQVASGINTYFSEVYVATKVARLNIKGNAITYRLIDTTGQMFTADTRAARQKFKLDSHQEGSVFVTDFSAEDIKYKKSNNDESNSANIKLNANPEWEININAGVTDLDFDLSKYKLRSLKIEGGAGQFVVKVGQPLESTNVVVSTGASDVTINVPKDAACRIELQAGLSSNTLDGFPKKDDTHYETAGFDKAKNKLYIQLTGAISDFKVKKY